MIRVCSVIALALLLFCSVLAQSGRADARNVRIRFHIAERDTGRVADEAFVSAQREAAQRVFGALGLRLVEEARDTLPARHAVLRSRADRDALGGYVTRGAIHCMVVAELMDVDEPGRVRRGVHWRVRKDPARHFVIVSAISGPYVLAHELGHFLGNQAHSEVQDNLMSYDQTGAIPFLSPLQVNAVERTLGMMFASGELAP
jgi:hypothetical protein